MDTSLALELLAILVLVLANGFFALSEFSIIASRRSRLQQKIEQGKRGARWAMKLHERPDQFLATIQVGLTLMGTLAGVFGGVTLVEPLHRWLEGSSVDSVRTWARTLAVVIVTLAITGTSVVLGELVPKYLALSNPERFARLVAHPMRLFTQATSIFSRSLSYLANLVVRAAGVRTSRRTEPIGEDEINLMILEGKQKGVFDETEEKLIKSVFAFADSTARRAMTPRTDAIGIEISLPAEEIIDLVIKHGHSRYPVYDKTIDHVVGMLYAKDLLQSRFDPHQVVLEDLMRKAHFIPDSMPLSRVLWDFQRRRGRMAIVLDEFGGTAGIITLHDILEELVGEMQDEDETRAAELVKHSETVVFADGSVWPGAVNELIGGELPEEEFETLAGLCTDHLGRLPEKNESVEIANLRVTVLEKVDNRLVRLKLERLPADNENRA